MCTTRPRRKRVAAGVAAAAVLCAVAVGPAGAALLADDETGMLHGWQYFDTAHIPELGITLFAADIEYCVYAPGAFTQRPEFAGESVDPGHFVYAYQIAEVYDGAYGPGSGYVNQFSVGLSDRDEEATNIGYVQSTGAAPSSSAIVTGSAKWVFSPGVFSSGNPSMPPAPSGVLYFTSRFAPEFDNATATGAGYDTQLMPSPGPEPATAAVLGLGGALLALRKKRRWAAKRSAS